MIYSIKAFLFVFIIAFCAQAQDSISNSNQYMEDPETVFFGVEVLRSVPLNNSALKESYRLYPGLTLDFNWFVLPRLTIGTQYSIFGGRVIDKSKVGNISGSNIHSIGVTIGYYHMFTREWNLHSTAGIGHLYYGNRAPEDNFTEEGTGIWIQSSLAYRINRTVGIYLKAQLRQDQLNIRAPQDQLNFLNKHSLLNLGFGIRFNLQNPGG